MSLGSAKPLVATTGWAIGSLYVARMWPRPLATLCNRELVVDAVGGGRAVKVSERLLTRFVSGPGPGLHRSTELSPVLSPRASHRARCHYGATREQTPC